MVSWWGTGVGGFAAVRCDEEEEEEERGRRRRGRARRGRKWEKEEDEEWRLCVQVFHFQLRASSQSFMHS